MDLTIICETTCLLYLWDDHKKEEFRGILEANICEPIFDAEIFAAAQARILTLYETSPVFPRCGNIMIAVFHENLIVSDLPAFAQTIIKPVFLVPTQVKDEIAMLLRDDLRRPEAEHARLVYASVLASRNVEEPVLNLASDQTAEGRLGPRGGLAKAVLHHGMDLVQKDSAKHVFIATRDTGIQVAVTEANKDHGLLIYCDANKHLLREALLNELTVAAWCALEARLKHASWWVRSAWTFELCKSS